MRSPQGFATAAHLNLTLGRRSWVSRRLPRSGTISMGRMGPAEALAERAVQVAGDDVAARARALHMLQFVLESEGKPMKARRAGVLALEACELAGDQSRALEVLTIQAAYNMRVGAFDKAIGRLDSIIDRSKRLGNGSVDGYAVLNRGLC